MEGGGRIDNERHFELEIKDNHKFVSSERI